MEPKKKASADELDAFWDIDALLPARGRPNPAERRRVEAVDVTVAAMGDPPPAEGGAVPIPPREDATVVHSRLASLSGISGKRRVYPPPPEAPKPEEVYEPESALLHRVELYRWHNDYRYYEAFCQTARALRREHGTPASPVPFFSYVPQYDQMSQAQTAWYLCLRDCIERECYPETDYSYLLLLVYEIINLGASFAPARGQRMLCRIWEHYRVAYPQLDGNLPEWICDYSLIHHLPPPPLSNDARAELMRHCTLKEFYVAAGAVGMLQALLGFCSNYDYRKSKFYTPENQPLFDRVIPQVLERVTEAMSQAGKPFSASGMEDSRMTRLSFSGALCTAACKRRMEISYCSFSRSHELRFLITDIVKHTENRLRARLGIRSRMTVYSLPDNVRAMIDAECLALLPPKAVQVKKRAEQPPAYEALYDLPKTPMDPVRAAEIEHASWDTTRRLLEAFDRAEPDGNSFATEPEAAEQQPPEIPQGEPERAAAPPETDSGFARYRQFLLAVRAGDGAAIRMAAQALGALPDAVADEVNELAVEQTGDILLEDPGDGWQVIADYGELLDHILSDI